MSKRKTMDKAQARERRNRLLESAAAAELSLTEGVREMRAIAGMTQEDFARHREVSARVIKAIELGQGNPTVATLNRIGQFFGLEVGFVPTRRTAEAEAEALPGMTTLPSFQEMDKARESIMRKISEALTRLDDIARSFPQQVPVQKNAPPGDSTGDAPSPKKRKTRSP